MRNLLMRRRCDRGLVEPAGGEGNSDKRGQGFRSGFPHDRGAMIVHGTLADPQVRRDILAWVAGQNELENLTLAARQALDFRRCILLD